MQYNTTSTTISWSRTEKKNREKNIGSLHTPNIWHTPTIAAAAAAAAAAAESNVHFTNHYGLEIEKMLSLN